ncbi:MAG: HpsJ family protein [Prochlorothrix sp.]|nr:HpsJ family protein [Prochlorothrix sp.]
MKSGSQRQLASITPLSLTLVGSIMVLSVLLDYAAFLLWPQFKEQQWQMQVVSTAVDRGIVPLVGMTLLLVGYWTAEQVPTPLSQTLSRLPLRMFAFLLASLLSLLFLLCVPLHLRNSFAERAATLESIQTQADTLTTQAQEELKAQVEQQRTRITALIKNEQQLNQAISSGQLSVDEATLLQQFRDQPNSLDEYLTQQAEAGRQEAEKTIQDQKSNAERQAKERAVKAGVRTAVTSFLLAIGYALMGWTGLRESRKA